MKGQGFMWVRGSVVVEVRGGAPEDLVNKALAGGLALSAIRWTSRGLLQFELSLNDFFRMRPYLRETGCRMHVTQRRGMPFSLARAEKRIWFVGGIALFFAIIFMLSSIVWSVDVEGNVKLTREQVLQAAKQEGIYPMQWSFRLKDADVMSRNLVNALPGTTWIGVEKKGTKVRIQVVEMSLPDEKELQSPRNLVASEDAVVTQIIAETGKPLVKKNARVKKGQTLISGIIGSESNSRALVAEGTVRGLVWYEFKVEVPLTQQIKVYTGEQKKSWHLVLGSRALKVSGFGKSSYESSETIQELQKLSWRGFTLPIGRLKETVKESEMQDRQISGEEAKNIGLLQARADVMEKAGEDAVIQDEIVLHEEADNGKVYMKVLFEVDQSIVKEMPLVQMQGE
ncbi:sporulation protein YqfD [Paenibacillus sp. HB172176]|uniref:sporulation protein YqfD n=1 Tax=Paenibacillus sp. HB172176 TaxID=2493690 RepID=UPI00143BEE31|nr:sporulation protein YqfD [Paenibacillus sp. HB172176]